MVEGDKMLHFLHHFPRHPVVYASHIHSIVVASRACVNSTSVTLPCGKVMNNIPTQAAQTTHDPNASALLFPRRTYRSSHSRK